MSFSPSPDQIAFFMTRGRNNEAEESFSQKYDRECKEKREIEMLRRCSPDCEGLSDDEIRIKKRI